MLALATAVDSACDPVVVFTSSKSRLNAQVLDETVEEKSAAERNDIGMVVIRGNCIIQFECLERL